MAADGSSRKRWHTNGCAGDFSSRQGRQWLLSTALFALRGGMQAGVQVTPPTVEWAASTRAAPIESPNSTRAGVHMKLPAVKGGSGVERGVNRAGWRHASGCAKEASSRQ